jgi:phospholipase/carboxylesterase
MQENELLTYRTIEPRKVIGEGNPLLLLLHGRGADEHDLLGLAPHLDERLRVVSARAPFQFEWGPGYAWYDIEEVGKPDAYKFPASREKIGALIDELQKKFPVSGEKIFLLGFSMGAVMSFDAALSFPEKVRGVIAHSGYIAEGVEYRWEDSKDVEFFVAHGNADPVIPVDFGRRADELLARRGMQYTYKEYGFGHQIGEESLRECVHWLGERL